MDLANIHSYLGISLSEYHSIDTAVVRLKIEAGTARFEILNNHPFNNYRPEKPIAIQIENEINFLYEAYHKKSDHIVIDVPIDLSQLPMFQNESIYLPNTNKLVILEKIKQSWELKLRPIDQALNRPAPILSPLSSVTQRTQLALTRSFASESCPSFSRKLVGYDEVSSVTDLKYFEKFLQVRGIQFKSYADAITQHEFDAMWCALVGIVNDCIATSHNAGMKNSNYAAIVSKMAPLEWPKDYRLLVKWPSYIIRLEISRNATASCH